ncbi:MAG TPA: homoserine O-acetyltransferase [Puia sp.]
MKFKYLQPFTLESGAVLPGYHLGYTTHGTLNETGDNVIWIFHALTANSDPAEWWPGLVGNGRLFDPSVHFIICVNMPGSCYGSIGPLDREPDSGEAYYQGFPFFTPRDMIRAYQPLRKFLGIRKVYVGIGGSMGGQQLLEWAIEEPELFCHIVPIATNGRHSPWGIAFNTSQRMAIEADNTWKERREDAGLAGMSAARATALLSYRDYAAYEALQPRPDGFLSEMGTDAGPGTGSAGTILRNGAASYQRYQGEKLARRFNAFSYYMLSLSMDSHDVGRGRGGLAKALQGVRARTLVISIETDILFPRSEQQLLASCIPGAGYRLIHSLYGHDGFLLEYAQIERLIRDFVEAPVELTNNPYKYNGSNNSTNV